MRPEQSLLCVYLNHWPIDRLRRRVTSLRHEPFVLIDAAHPRQLITAVSPELPAIIQPGMPLAQARAFDAALRHEPADPTADAHALEALARWLMRFTPNVAIDPPNALFLDIAGTHRLFGPIPRLRQLIVTALDRFQITAGVAIAPTPSAAWALAAYGNTPMSTLEELPPESLRLDPAVIQHLHALGLNQVARIYQLPREQLASRFGPALLKRLDQIHGDLPDPLSYLPHRRPITAQIRFDGVVDSQETIQLAVAQLLGQVTQQLTRRGQGARQLRLLFQPLYAPPVEKKICLTRPNRDPKSLLKIISVAIETITATEGFIAIHLTVPVFESLGHNQPGLSEDGTPTGIFLDHLIDRLQARFHRSVEWTVPIESHLPETAYGVGDEPEKVSGDTRVQLKNAGAAGSGTLRLSSPKVDWDLQSRPMRLLTYPREIRVTTRPSDRDDGSPAAFTDRSVVHHLDSVQGPERIEGQWWNNHWETRDYYDVADLTGGRHWLFRLIKTRQWFLHGTFE